MAIRFLNKEPVRNMPDEGLVSKFTETKQHLYFEELYRRYRHLSFGVCLNLLKNEDDARDVTAEVFKILFIKLPSSNVKSFKSYLYAVTRNECIGLLRSRKTASKKMAEFQYVDNSFPAFMENEALGSLVNGGPSIEVVVEKAVNDLGSEQKRCIHMFFYEDKSYKEIAEETGYSEKQVKSYLQNGKRNLRIILDGELKKYTA